MTFTRRNRRKPAPETIPAGPMELLWPDDIPPVSAGMTREVTDAMIAGVAICRSPQGDLYTRTSMRVLAWQDVRDPHGNG